MVFIYICILLIVWFIIWRPSMVDAFKNRKTNDAGIKQLDNIEYIEDILKEWKDK